MEKQCNRCCLVKAVDQFGFTGRPDGSRRGVCLECRRQRERETYGERVKAAGWSVEEDAVILAHYWEGGVNTCKPLLPERSVQSIQQRAHRLKMTRAIADESVPWPLPQQESAPMHLLFQRTALPVFSSALVPSV